MSEMSTEARSARVTAARRSPEIATLHDEPAWLALYTNDAVVEDPVGAPPCQRGVFTRPGKKDDLERFYATFIAPSEIRVDVRSEVVVGNTVIRDVILNVRLSGGARAAVPAILRYELVEQDERLLVSRMRAYWDAGRNGREVLASGLAGKISSALSGFRLMRVLGKDWAGRYLEGTKRGIRREGGPKVEALGRALGASDVGALDAIATADATVTLPGASPSSLRSLDGKSLALTFVEPMSSGFFVAARCHATHAGREVRGLAFVSFDESSKKIRALELFWE